MRTSLNEIREMEEYLQDKMPVEETLLFKARLLTNPLLRLNLFFQKKALVILRLYHHKKLREELNEVHERLFSDPVKKDFQQYFQQLFKK